MSDHHAQSRARFLRKFAAPVAALAALALVPAAAQARDIAGALTYRDRAALPADAHVLIELRNAMGDVVAEHRFDTNGAQVPLAFEISGAPDDALRLRAGIFVGGQPLRISAFQTIAAGSEAVALDPVVLDPHVAMGFSTRLRCGTTEIELGFVDDNARLRVGREVIDLAQAPAASGARFISATLPDTEVHTRGNTTRITLRGRDLGECRPSTGADLFPLEAIGTDAPWLLRIDAATLSFRDQPDGPEIVAPTPAGFPVPGDAGETAALRFDLPTAQLRILLRDQVCNGAGPLPRPVSITIEEGGQMSEGCGGEPMALLAGGDWVVHYIGGTEIMPGDGIRLHFADGRISGASGCNRFSGGFQIHGRGVTIAGIALTRMACHPARMAREAEFIAQLRNVSGFIISDDGRLHLTDSAGNVLISAQR